MLQALADPDVWIALISLSAMEIVLGIDNIVFLSILVGRLPPKDRASTRRLGLAAALVMRLGLLAAISAIMRLVDPLVWIGARWFSGKDLILIAGGLFLLAKATHELHRRVEVGAPSVSGAGRARSRGWIVAQIMVIDAVFALDSVITAVGMADQLWVMAAAMLVAVGVMLVAVDAISEFVERHPTVKVLALSFLLLIGVVLIADGLHQHLDKGYVYFAMGFALFVELLNLRRRPVTGSTRDRGGP